MGTDMDDASWRVGCECRAWMGSTASCPGDGRPWLRLPRPSCGHRDEGGPAGSVPTVVKAQAPAGPRLPDQRPVFLLPHAMAPLSF